MKKAEKDKISIIVPIYNAEQWLETCIESVENQSYKNIELLLINDGSTDKSEEICKNYSRKYNNIRVYTKINSGASAARNYGLKRATGEFIQFLDSDDFLEPECCQVMHNIMRSEKADLVFCGLKIWKNKKLLRTPNLSSKTFCINESVKNYKFVHPIFASPCNKMFKKELIKTYFDTDKNLGEDLTFNLNYIKNCNIVSTTEQCLYNVRLDNENSLNRKFRENRLDIMLELNTLEKEYCEKTYINQDISFFYNQFILSFHYYFKEIINVYSQKKVLNLIQKYIKDERIKEALKKSRFKNKYYSLLKVILLTNNKYLIYFFIKTRKFLEKIIMNNNS